MWPRWKSGVREMRRSLQEESRSTPPAAPALVPEIPLRRMSGMGGGGLYGPGDNPLVAKVRWTKAEIEAWMEEKGAVNTLCGSTEVNLYPEYDHHCPKCLLLATDLLNGHDQ